MLEPRFGFGTDYGLSDALRRAAEAATRLWMLLEEEELREMLTEAGLIGLMPAKK